MLARRRARAEPQASAAPLAEMRHRRARVFHLLQNFCRVLQQVLVATQIAVAIVLLVGAALLIRSFARLADVSPGFEPAGVLTFRMSASWSESATSVVSRLARTLRRLEQVPGVDAAAVSQTLPAGIDFPPGEFSIAWLPEVTSAPLTDEVSPARDFISEYLDELAFLKTLSGKLCTESKI